MISYADLVATLAMVASLGGLTVQWLVWRHQNRSKSPIVSGAHVRFGQIPEGWISVTVGLRSRSNEGWRMVRLQVDKPQNALIIATMAASDCDRHGRWVLVADKLARAKPAAEPSLSVAPEGATQLRQENHVFMGTGDEHHEDFLLKLPLVRSRKRELISPRVSNVELTAFLISQTQASRRRARPIKQKIHIPIISTTAE